MSVAGAIGAYEHEVVVDLERRYQCEVEIVDDLGPELGTAKEPLGLYSDVMDWWVGLHEEAADLFWSQSNIEGFEPTSFAERG